MKEGNIGPDSIAIIGLSYVSGQQEGFWRVLQDNAFSISLFDSKAPLATQPQAHGAESASRQAAWLSSDACLIGLRPEQAEALQPGWLLLLRCAQEALETAGYGGQSSLGRVGAFIRSDSLPVPELEGFLKRAASLLTSSSASALDAVHLACRSLLRGECDLALSGGLSSSPSAGLVVLKKLGDALADGDSIQAVIRGSASQHGLRESGGDQSFRLHRAQAVADALASAGVEAGSVGYLGASATDLRPDVEIAALHSAFEIAGLASRNAFCALDWVNPNPSQPDAALDDAAGLIQAILALKHGVLPSGQRLGAGQASGSFYVNSRPTRWETGNPRRALASSFGAAGADTHLVIQEAPAAQPPQESRPWQLLALSAHSDAALDVSASDLAEHFRRNSRIDLADAAYTLQVGRRTLSRRRALVCRSLGDAVEQLGRPHSKRPVNGAAARAVAFMFPGQGGHHENMGLGLYREEPVFRQQLDHCAVLLEPQLGFDLRKALFPRGREAGERNVGQLAQMSVSQPALFAVEYALARLWMSWGIRPQSMIGHSIGEFVAACLAGVFSREDGLTLMAARGRLTQQMPQGAMLAIPLPESDVEPLLNGDLCLAAINGHALCVVSGPVAAVEAFRQDLSARRVRCQMLSVNRALHSKWMSPAVKPFLDEARKVAFSPPRIPIISTLTGERMTDAQAVDPAYWVRNLTDTVRLAPGLGRLFQQSGQGGQVLLEVGPQTLASVAKRHPEKAASDLVLSSLPLARAKKPDLDFLLSVLGRIWVSGVDVDWEGFHQPAPRRRIPLPTSPFGAAPGAAGSPQQQENAAEASNEAQRVLVDLWQKLFGIEQVGIDDNFFELGGNSLLATQALTQIRRSFGIELSMRAIFKAPTIAELARLIEAASPQTSLPAIRPVDRRSDLPLSFAQQRLWVLNQLAPQNPAYNSPMAWELRGPLKVVGSATCPGGGSVPPCNPSDPLCFRGRPPSPGDFQSGHKASASG